MEELVTNVLNLKAEVNYLKGVVNKLVAESRKNKFMESNVLEADCPTDSALWEFLKNAAGGGENINNLKNFILQYNFSCYAQYCIFAT